MVTNIPSEGGGQALIKSFDKTPVSVTFVLDQPVTQ